MAATCENEGIKLGHQLKDVDSVCKPELGVTVKKDTMGFLSEEVLHPSVYFDSLRITLSCKNIVSAENVCFSHVAFYFWLLWVFTASA